jgi:MFS family permease
MNQSRQLSVWSLPVLVAALGYFVDIYDLLLFSIIRVPSLKSIGLSDIEIREKGSMIISAQMWGMLAGGILWGVLGDKKGRLSVLFGSILLYSLANIANGLVHTADQYAIVRFIAGVGLAGELGAGITLVSELTVKEKRGIATSLVAGLGLTGAIFAFIMGQHFDWRVCYYIGGGLGFLLLLLRISVSESGLYNALKETEVKRGNFFMLFSNGKRLKKYLLSISVGLPSWLIVGVLLTFAKEFGEAMHMAEPVNSGKAVMYSYVGVSAGGLLIGFLSQWLKSRKKSLYIFYIITIVFTVLFFMQYNGSALGMYFIAFGLGFGTGFWAVFVTIAAEQFGTNLRSTAATTIPNFVRGSLPIMLIMAKFFSSKTNYITGAEITSVIVLVIVTAGTIWIKETYNKDLNFIEE